jgi:hypothetical protein
MIHAGYGRGWDQVDQAAMDRDLERAGAILRDALEEIDFVPQSPAERKAESGPRQPSVVININNVLSQVTEVNVNQLLAGLAGLGLKPEVRAEAEEHARELEAEVKGAQRWPVLAKSLDKLSKLGKPVYEHVVIPLLLEMLKKQIGG